MIHVIDADDLREGYTGAGTFSQVVPLYPNGFKVTLFAIPGLCCRSLLKDLSVLPWIEIAAHGWKHPTPRECERWTYEESINYLHRIETRYGAWIVKGYKAPGWQISDGMYRALLERGWWVADQTYNNFRRPKELPAYTLAVEEGLHKHHFHLGHLGGRNSNELAETGGFLEHLGDDSEFLFISEVVR